MSKPWGNIGAWAADSELAEAEEREATVSESHNFPSLKDAVTAKPKKNKKMTLMEFNSVAGTAASDYKGLTQDEMLALPTGPKQRSSEEMQFNRLGGGFSSYGGARSSDGEGRWGGGRRSYGGFEDERKGGGPHSSRVSDFDQPSRADEVDDWGSAKKTLPSMDSGRQNRFGARSDGVDNWALGKKSTVPSRSHTFGSGFGNSSSEPDRWSRRERENDRERPRLVLDPPRGESSVKPNPFGAARPREEVLAEKGLVESGSSLQGAAEEEIVVKTRPRVNPFGNAKPREVLLEERGKDWRKIDFELEHRRVDRSETVEEKLLKEEIANLKKELENESTMDSNKQSTDEAGEDQTSGRAMLLQKERELEFLVRDLDDKVRFGQKAIERSGSTAVKATGFPDRPPSQSGSNEDSGSMESGERPQSRGTGDTWMRTSDDRRPFQGSRDRGGFLSSSDLNRSRSGERW